MNKPTGVIIFATFFGLIFLLASCTQVTSTTTTTTTTTIPAYDSYFPLVSGHLVTYEVATSVPVDATNPATTYETSTTSETWQFDQTVTLFGSLSVFRVNVIKNGSVTANYYQENHHGLRYYGSGSYPTTEAVLMLAYPLTVGSTWEYAPWSFPFTVMDEATIVTAAGSFLCKRVKPIYIGGGYSAYAKDVGLIKMLSGGDALPTTTVSREIIGKNF